jgi:hypothetical protein
MLIVRPKLTHPVDPWAVGLDRGSGGVGVRLHQFQPERLHERDVLRKQTITKIAIVSTAP